MSTDVVKEPMYTWTFSHRSLLIRLYLWIYEPDNPSSTTFCKLFWGTILTPITLPLTILLRVLGYTAKIVKWVALHSGVPQIFRAIGAWQDRRIYARIEQRHEAARRSLEPEPAPVMATPQPKKPNIPSRVVAWTSERADKVVAYFQEHPEVKEKVDTVTAYTGKVFVRGIFYPLMILVPIVAFAFIGWQIEQHWHGGAHGMMWFGNELGHYLWRVLELVGLWVLLCVGAFAGLGILIVGSCWMSVQYDKMFPAKAPNYVAKIGPGKDAWRGKEDGGIVYQGGHIIAERWGAPLTTTGKVVIWPFKMIVLALAGILLLFWKVACACGRGASNTASFMIAGHHTVKYRTCPKILITEDEAA